MEYLLLGEVMSETIANDVLWRLSTLSRSCTPFMFFDLFLMLLSQKYILPDALKVLIQPDQAPPGLIRAFPPSVRFRIQRFQHNLNILFLLIQVMTHIRPYPEIWIFATFW